MSVRSLLPPTPAAPVHSQEATTTPAPRQEQGTRRPKRERQKQQEPSNFRSGRDSHLLDQKAPLLERLAQKDAGTYRRPKGRPSAVHSFLLEPSAMYCMLLSLPFLSETELDSLCGVHRAWGEYFDAKRRLANSDISFLRRPREDWSSATDIDQRRTEGFLALAIRYNFDVPRMVEWLGGDFLYEHRDAESILAVARPMLTEDAFCNLRRLYAVGAPAQLLGTSSLANLRAFRSYGNHRSVLEDPATMTKAIVKDERNSHLLHLPEWTAEFVPNLHVSPLALLKKKGKFRLIFDATFRPQEWCTAINDITHKDDEPPVHLGTVFQRYLTWIWNLRISFPQEEILLWDDDVKSAFRHVRYMLHVIAAFAFIYMGLLFLPLGCVFGSNVSPAEWEIIGTARCQIAEAMAAAWLASGRTPTPFEVMGRIQWPAPPAPATPYVQAERDAVHEGITDSAGREQPPRYFMFVDDCMLADIRRRMYVAIYCSLASLFLLLGTPNPGRELVVALDKFADRDLSHRRVQLGFLIDTRLMLVLLPPEKKAALLAELKHWHDGRKGFTAKEAARLLGSLQHACYVCHWAQYLYLDLQADLQRALFNNRRYLERQFARSTRLLADGGTPDWNAKVWKVRNQSFLSGRAKRNIAMLVQILDGSVDARWECPISRLVPRARDWLARGDASMEAAG